MNAELRHARSHQYAVLLRIALRVIGTVSMTAAVAVFMPYEWMDAIHRAVGLGPLPQDPVVGYLARTLSAFYVFLGGLMWVTSFDLQRHRRVNVYLVVTFLVFGVIVIWVDFKEGMPVLWGAIEGPLTLVCGSILLWLSLRIHRPH